MVESFEVSIKFPSFGLQGLVENGIYITTRVPMKVRTVIFYYSVMPSQRCERNFGKAH
jgi:hypothetical protein